MFDDKYITESKGINLVAYYKEIRTKSLPRIFTHMHYHSDFEILYIVSGKAKMAVNTNTFLAEKGSLILVNPYEVHYGEIISESFAYYCIDFNLSLISHERQEEILKEELKYANHIKGNNFENYIKDIYEAYENEPVGWKLAAKGNLMLLFSKLEASLGPSKPAKDNDFSKKVINYIAENFSDNITSKSAA